MAQEDAQPVVLSHHAGVRHDILTETLLGILPNVGQGPGRLIALANNCQQLQASLRGI